MPRYDRAEIAGRVKDVFPHRFVPTTSAESRPAYSVDPDPFDLFVGATSIAGGALDSFDVTFEKITAKDGAHTIVFDAPELRHDLDPSPDFAIRAVRAAGFQPLGTPRRKPKHFEVLARLGYAYLECQVTFDGRIHREKVVASRDPKWADDIKAAS